jgi:glycosyltransferase involved in cell wall biosynthesis
VAPEFSVIIPAHNEADNLQNTVDAITDELGDDGYEIRIVNDTSTDATPDIADRLAADHGVVRVTHRETDPGFGNAIKDGLDAADGDVLIPFMADLSDDPADIPTMLDAMADGSDVVHGSRFVAGGSVDGYPPMKLFYNRAYNTVLRLLLRTETKDLTNAFTAYRRDVIEAIRPITADDFDITAELAIKAELADFDTTEVPVSWQSREHGVSDFDPLQKGPMYAKRLATLLRYR